jgi:hypothetical protein
VSAEIRALWSRSGDPRRVLTFLPASAGGALIVPVVVGQKEGGVLQEADATYPQSSPAQAHKVKSL